MRKIFLFESPRGHYVAGACIIACIDDRFSSVLETIRAHLALTHADVVRFAGGAKTIAVPSVASDRDALLRQIETAVQLHKATKVILTTHEDCGACGGSAAFGNKPDAELAAHERWLNEAERLVKAGFPAILIQKIYLRFDGAEWL